MVERKYVDVNVFVYWLGGHPEFGQRALGWVKRIERARRGEFITSSLTLYEILVILAGLTERNLKDFSFVSSVLSDLSRLRGLEVVPLTREDFTKALDLMREYKLDLEDALHLAVALREEATVIVSNDSDYDRTPLRREF